VALDARVWIAGPRGARDVAAEPFFRGLLTTALEPDEILTAVELPAPPSGWGFAEIARRPGDFALAGVAAALRIAPGAPVRVEAARLVGFGIGDRPRRLAGAEQCLAGAILDATAAARAGAATAPDCDPPSDVHGSADYRRHLATVLTERALLQAASRLEGRR
jgi:carbon-monoxide dehydrogenase medium subunit